MIQETPEGILIPYDEPTLENLLWFYAALNKKSGEEISEEQVKEVYAMIQRTRNRKTK